MMRKNLSAVMAATLIVLATPAAASDEDGLSVYAVCLAAGYSQALAHYKKPLESFARARLACDGFREALKGELWKRTSDADGVLRELDMAIYRRLSQVDRRPVASSLDELERR